MGHRKRGRRWCGIPGRLLLVGALQTCGLGVTACSEGRPSSDAAVHVDTASDGRVTISHPAPTTVRWRIREVQRLGRREAADGGAATATPEAAQAFGGVVSIALGPGGETIVADGPAHRVKVFGRDGALLLEVGGEGEGPGEFRFLSGAMMTGDGDLWAMDALAYRLTRFRDGEVAGTWRLRRSLTVTIPWAGTVRDDGVVVDVARFGDGTDPGIFLYRLLEAGEAVRTDSMRLPVPDVELHARSSRLGQELSAAPFSPTLVYAVAPAGEVWLARTDTYRFHRMDAGGDTMLTVEVRETAAPLDRTVRDSAARASGIPVEEIPEGAPMIRTLLAGSDGRVWVERWTREGMSWDVFAADGTFEGRAEGTETPGGLARPAASGRCLLTPWRDALDVDYVVRWALEDVEGTAEVTPPPLPPPSAPCRPSPAG